MIRQLFSRPACQPLTKAPRRKALSHKAQSWRATSSKRTLRLEQVESRLLLSVNPGDFQLSELLSGVDIWEGVFFEDQLYFTGDTGNSDVGIELWKYNPTGNAGLGSLTIAADINVGSGDSYPSNLTIFNGKLYFSADDGIHGDELWEFDPATNDGMGAARLVEDLRDGGSSSPFSLTAVGGNLYFTAYDEDWSELLWKFDPAANEGAGAISSVVDLTGVYDSPSIKYLTAMDDRLYFVAANWDGATETNALWQFDPTASSGVGEASLIEDFGEYFVEYPTLVDGQLYFSLYDSNYVEEVDPLWVYDPLANGGVGELRSYSSPDFDYVDYVVEFQNELFFVGYYDDFGTEVIGRFDPTANDGAGAFHLVVDIQDFLDGPLVDYLYDMTVVGDSLFFVSSLYVEVYDEESQEYSYDESYVIWHYQPGDHQQSASSTPIFESDNYVSIVASSPQVIYISTYDWESGIGVLWSYQPGVPSQEGLPNGVTLSADINTEGLSLEFFEGVSLNGKFYFSGWPDRPEVGNELWVYDPLANDGAGAASLVADIFPGSDSSFPSQLTVVDGLLYFTTDDGNLWQFDPEAAAGAGELSLVPEEGEGSVGFGLWELTELGGSRYFVRSDSENGVELWRYDPAANDGAGATTIVIDIWAGDGSSWPEDLTVLDGSLYFIANDESWEQHLWRFDPLANGGEGLATRIDDPGFAYVTELAALDGRLYFAAGDNEYDQELWYYDPAGNGGLGEAAVAAVISETDFPTPRWLTPMAGSLYFSAYHPDHYISLWRFDPTANEGAGAAYVIEGTDYLHPQDLTPLDDILYLRGYNEWGDFYLYKYDPAADEGAGLFSLLTAPNHEFGFFEPSIFITASDGRLYFSPEYYVDGAKMWVYDPAADEGAGSANLVIIDGPVNESSNPYSLLALNGELYFFANDGIHGYELWRYDPITAESSLVVDILPGPLSSHPDDLVIMNDILYFTADDEFDFNQLWAFDPTANGGAGALTQTDVANQLNYLDNVVAFGGMLYFRGNDGTMGNELWRYDPSTNTTSLVADINPGSASSSPTQFTELDGKLYFQAQDGVNGYELWIYDPAANDGAGLVFLAADIREGSAGSNAQELTTLAGKLYFMADDGQSGFELWQYDPATGASLTADITEGSGSSYPQDLHAMDDKLYFAASETGSPLDQKLWRYDPSTGETTLILQFNGGGEISEMTSHEGLLYFSGDDGVRGEELWQYDPVADLATLVADLYPDGSSGPQGMTILDGKIYFTATDPIIGREIFVYDPAFMQAGGDFTTEFLFVETAGVVGTVASDGPGTHAIFHEWEDVTGELWLTIDSEVPTFPFEFTFQFSSTDSHLADPQLVSQLGTGSNWQTEVDADARVTTGILQGLNLSGYEVGDRVLIATILYPQDLENLVGISADLPGAYAQPIPAPGVEFLSANINGELDVDVTPEIGGQFVPVIYDTDDNGRIGLSDFVQFIGQYGKTPGAEFPNAYRFDFDRNDKVGLSDFVQFISNYGASKASPDRVNMPLMTALTEGEPISFATSMLEGEPDPTFPLSQTTTMATFDVAAEDLSSGTQETFLSTPPLTTPNFDPRLIDSIWQEESLEEADSEEEDEWLMALID